VLPKFMSDDVIHLLMISRSFLNVQTAYYAAAHRTVYRKSSPTDLSVAALHFSSPFVELPSLN
jgi:hypothetical protein